MSDFVYLPLEGYVWLMRAPLLFALFEKMKITIAGGGSTITSSKTMSGWDGVGWMDI